MNFTHCFRCMRETDVYPCSHCGYDPATAKPREYALRPGTILNGKYVVGTMLGQVSGTKLFLKEARKMSRVRDLFQQNGTAYIVMDFVEGKPLKDHPSNDGSQCDIGAWSWMNICIPSSI